VFIQVALNKNKGTLAITVFTIPFHNCAKKINMPDFDAELLATALRVFVHWFFFMVALFT